MKACTLLAAAAVLGLLSASSAAAQNLSLEIENGLVTLEADGVTIDEILACWTATTGLNVISKNGRGSDVPVTLRLNAVPERDALAMILRDLSGYIMGERRDPQSGVVSIDRLMILPDSAAQAPATMPTPAGRQPGGVRRGVPVPVPVPDELVDIGVASDAVIEPMLVEGVAPIELESPEAAPARPRRPGDSPDSVFRPGMIAPVPPGPTVQIGSPDEELAFRPAPSQP